ncbi:hypothetical protein G3N58_15115 [Paraburkholderia sp. Ac-20342]|uniref:hypothetical protein n=1 Tax=Paraburkholderia sp. Ac-20342 TaxID=2703889 RepID=UPI00197F1998|nr:hypothetical protein [Paraburkholderia sp. Ac-20342]MBN3848150.1 hypothetical protein [Paraburkholderia sp. Ac-20342]
MATVADLAKRVLQNLKVVGNGQTPDDEDLLIAEQKVSAAHASLKKDERVRWTLQEIPEAAEEPYVFMASFLAAPSFGQGLTQDVWDWGQREITSLISTPASGESTPTEYF